MTPGWTAPRRRRRPTCSSRMSSAPSRWKSPTSTRPAPCPRRWNEWPAGEPSSHRHQLTDFPSPPRRQRPWPPTSLPSSTTGAFVGSSTASPHGQRLLRASRPVAAGASRLVVFRLVSQAEPFLVQLLRWQAGLVQGRTDGGHQARRSAHVDVPCAEVGDHPLQRGGGEGVAPFTEDVGEAGTAAPGDVFELATEDELFRSPGAIEEQQVLARVQRNGLE